MSAYDKLNLKNHVCFPLYACSREVIKQYKPFLDELDLTYTQYIVMAVLWENHSASVKALGEALLLDSGTLTPLLKKLESKGLVTRRRSDEDERSLIVSLTPAGAALQEKAASLYRKASACDALSEQDIEDLRRILDKLLDYYRQQA